MRTIALVLALAAGIVASQIPEFAQQYRQRLGGAIDELARIIRNFDTDSARSGYDRTSALAVMARNEEQLVRDQSLRMAETIVRHARLLEQQQAFATGGPFVRLAAFAEDYDPPLVESTFRDYEPAIPTTGEGIVIGAAGFAVVYLLIRGIGFLFRSRRRNHLARDAVG
jgi:hypothetical protein